MPPQAFAALILALTLATASQAAKPTCSPKSMVKVVTRNITPGVDPNSFQGQPLVIYRQGSRFLRSEEAPDPPQGLHLLAVFSAPDIWMANLANHKGKHIVDPSPSIDVHAPVVTGPDVPLLFQGLEFGCEAEFVRRNAPKTFGNLSARGEPMKLHVLHAGSHRLDIIFNSQGRPDQVSYSIDGRWILVVNYDTFLNDLPLDPGLFKPPEGVVFEEAKP